MSYITNQKTIVYSYYLHIYYVIPTSNSNHSNSVPIQAERHMEIFH